MTTSTDPPDPNVYVPSFWAERFTKMVLGESLFQRFLPKPIRRTWRERLFTLPWRPWRAWKLPEYKPPAHRPQDRVKIRRPDDDFVDSVKYRLTPKS